MWKQCEKWRKGLGWYVKNKIEPLLVAAKASRNIAHERKQWTLNNSSKLKKNKENRNRLKKECMDNLFGIWRTRIKTIHGDNLKCGLKECTKALIRGTQEQSLRSDYIKYNTDKTDDSLLCRICGTWIKTISHILSECRKLVQKDYKWTHDSVGRYVFWQFCEKLGFNRTRFWYEHEPESVVENKNVKVLWDFTIQCDHMIEARRPDIAVVDKVNKETMITDVAIPWDTRVCNNERENIEKYILLKHEIARLWQMKKVIVIQIAVKTLKVITTK